MRVAIVITARNERRLLARNIKYHSYFGFTDFFVFFDQLDLRSYLEIKKFPGVQIRLSAFENVQKSGLQKRFPAHRYNTDHMVRQLAHMAIAIEDCRRLGIEWLASIDADELIAPYHSTGKLASLTSILRRAPANCSAYKLESYEVIPTRWQCANPFLELAAFKKTSPFGEGSRSDLIGGLTIPRNLAKRVAIGSRRPDYDPFWDLLEAGYQDPIMPPLTALLDEKRVSIIDWFVGHAMGKELARICPQTSFKHLHATHAPESTKQRAQLMLLHYNSYSFDDFRKKYIANFHSHPDQYASGWKLDPLKRLFRDATRTRTDIKLSQLYARYCFYSREKIREINTRFPGAVVIQTFPRELLLLSGDARATIAMDDFSL